MANQPRTSDDALRLARAIAIEQYAEMESQLCLVFAGLLGVKHDVAAIIFFKITSSDVRNSIIGTLLEQVDGDKFSAYWDGTTGAKKTPKLPGLWKMIRLLDDQRNYIVHWHAVSTAFAGQDGTTKHFDDFRPPFFWARLKDKKPLVAEDFDDFSHRADFVAQSLMVFFRATAPRPTLDAAMLQTWQPIFQRPPTYPPAADHPVRRLLRVP